MFTPTRITRQKDNVPIRSNIPQVNLFQENGSQRLSIHAQILAEEARCTLPECVSIVNAVPHSQPQQS